jgi:hypothetical protein
MGGVTITLVANVTAGSGTIISNTATATSAATSDPVPGNNNGTASTTVGP